MTPKSLQSRLKIAKNAKFGSTETEKERLESHGLTVREETFPHMNAKALFFRDPEGNTLELICHDRAINRDR